VGIGQHRRVGVALLAMWRVLGIISDKSSGFLRMLVA